MHHIVGSSFSLNSYSTFYKLVKVLNFRDKNFKTSEHFKKNEIFEIKIVVQPDHFEIFFNDQRLPLHPTFPYRQPLGEATMVDVNLEKEAKAMLWLALQIPDFNLPGKNLCLK